MATVDSKGLPHDAPSVTLTIRLLMAGKVSSIYFPFIVLYMVVVIPCSSEREDRQDGVFYDVQNGFCADSFLFWGSGGPVGLGLILFSGRTVMVYFHGSYSLVTPRHELFSTLLPLTVLRSIIFFSPVEGEFFYFDISFFFGFHFGVRGSFEDEVCPVTTPAGSLCLGNRKTSQQRKGMKPTEGGNSTP